MKRAIDTFVHRFDVFERDKSEAFRSTKFFANYSRILKRSELAKVGNESRIGRIVVDVSNHDAACGRGCNSGSLNQFMYRGRHSGSASDNFNELLLAKRGRKPSDFLA
eukprot:Gregarina_sp_Poly_1__9685@NODE_614_length_7136_cov_56_931815_g470_i0_p8_GENE_NODE_614_length_7136_cov_56_931815_g470_i0NODE_614_length_7136_cov_56_931815_g470_i0_p8_ORF_typecomplete_len108_score8_06_NODE_614_length_7136_cov_56_931815_g470_i013481671